MTVNFKFVKQLTDQLARNVLSNEIREILTAVKSSPGLGFGLTTRVDWNRNMAQGHRDAYLIKGTRVRYSTRSNDPLSSTITEISSSKSEP